MFQRGEGCKPTVQSYHDLIRPSPTDPGRSPIRPISVRPSIWEWQVWTRTFTFHFTLSLFLMRLSSLVD